MSRQVLEESEKENTLLEDVVEAGIPYDSHYSDLYIPDTKRVRELLKKHGVLATPFINQVEGGLWLDCYGQYTPYWENKSR